MDYENDIGKFVILSYKKSETEPVLTIFGKFEISEDGMWNFINLKDPYKSKVVNPKYIIVVEWASEAIRGGEV